MSPLPELRYETDPDAQQHPPDEPATVAQVEFVEPSDTPTDDVICGERVARTHR